MNTMIQSTMNAGINDKKWEVVSGGAADDFWKPVNNGDVIEGKLSGSFDGNFGKVYLLEVDKRVIGLPSNIMLQNLLMKVPLHSNCRVTFEGTKLNERKQSFKVFKVEVERDNKLY